MKKDWENNYFGIVKCLLTLVFKSSWNVLVDFFTSDIDDVISKKAVELLNSEDRDSYLKALEKLKTCDRVDFVLKNGEVIALVNNKYKE